MIDIKTSFAGLNLKNPIIIGSSGLSDTAENMIELEKQGAAAIVLKSLFEEEIIKEINARLNRMSSDGFLYPETVDYYDNMQSSDEPAIQYLETIRNAKSLLSIPVIASINCITSSQWTSFPGQIQQAGADALELNIFMLPSDFNRNANDNENLHFNIIKEVKKQVTIPVIVKLSYYFSDLAPFIQRLSHSGINGLVLFNRSYNPDIDIQNLEFTSGTVLSNPNDLFVSLRWIGILSGRVDCSLGASTGIHDGHALIKQILAGAHAVEIASTIYKNGTGQIGLMLKDLVEWMQKKGMKNLDHFRGIMSQFRSDNPAAYERIQFMKYFRGFQGK